MTTRRRLVFALTAGIIAVPLARGAQQAAKVQRVGMLLSGTPSDTGPMVAAFRQALRELRYVEGKNISIELRWASTGQDLSALAAELVRKNVDIVVTQGTAAAQAVKRETNTIPIVMATSGDPVAVGLIATLARPGGNVTGNSLQQSEFAGKWLELLKEIVPGASRIAVVSNPANPTHALFMNRTRAAASALGVALHVFEVLGPDDFERAFRAATKGHVHALILLPDPVLTAHSMRLANLALKHRLPSMYGAGGFAEAGGLANYGPSILEMFRRAANYVDKILKGAKPADLPVEQPTKFELVVNLKTAKALGLTLPQPFLMRADRVIE